MAKPTWFEEKLSQFKNDVEFLTEEKILEFNEIIVKRMEKLEMNRAQLAKRLHVTKSYVTKILNGDSNLTIKTMVAIAQSLDCKLDIDLCPAGYEFSKFKIIKILEKAFTHTITIPKVNSANNLKKMSFSANSTPKEDDYALAS